MKSAEAAAPTPEGPANSGNVVPLRPSSHTRRAEREFLPAALEIIETPASPAGRAVAATLIVFFLIALAWSIFGHIDIIATAPGKIVPVGRTKVIQPLETGMVTAVHVRDGDRVKEGQILVEFDRTASTSERNRIRHDYLRSRLDVARLAALRAGLDAGTGSGEFVPPEGAPAYEVSRTRASMIAQAEQQAAKMSALDQQIAQKVAEAEEIAAVIAKLNAGLPLIAETAEVRERVMKMEFGNRIAHLDAQLKLSEQRHDLVVQERRAAESLAARKALEAQREQTRAEYARGIMTELAEAEPKVAQFTEDLVKAEKRMQDQILRAPIDGTVQQLALHTIGGVVTPAQALMVVVPTGAGIEIEAMIPNKDIGFVREGDDAEIKIDTFNFTRYGLLHGKVLSVSQDAVIREKPANTANSDRQSSGQAARSSEPPGQELIFAARVSLDRTNMQIDNRVVELAPGMATTVEIKTGQRRVIEYLLSPLLRYKQESLRER
ncbi:hemolysin secretion protein D [Bradyrhizobium lablabi]|uniref:Membrane fusion protein (MFP) family protein n=1 Tax=Bradyrhizobium lablabi TaxID=722472 RepID=A0A0R3MN12_9BRAD|nr:HlyD family type I secretion periplasmic adaptor subunit [Bradyrhizobium lablabi]KRR21543.1 hemolysin secretion protein D [Bradyrhizobium lablabi]